MMSTGGYDSVQMSPTHSLYDSRRTPTHAPSYNRPSNIQVARRVSTSPGPSRRFAPYDSYVPPRPAPAYRDESPKVYRPNVYRPDYQSSHYPRSPSPERYSSPRTTEPDIWDRAWQLPYKGSGWQERKLAPPSPTTSRERVRQNDELLAARMLEPSDAWKKTHVDRPPRIDTSGLDNFEINSHHAYRSEKTIRSPSAFPVVDRYRPPSAAWDNFSSRSSEYDSYRPPYETAWVQPNNRESPSPARSFKGGSAISTHIRAGSHYEPNYHGRRVSSSGSHTSSISPHPRNQLSPSRRPRFARSPSPERPPSSEYPTNSNGTSTLRYSDSEDTSSKKQMSRSSSRSSIASSHPSDKFPRFAQPITAEASRGTRTKESPQPTPPCPVKTQDIVLVQSHSETQKVGSVARCPISPISDAKQTVSDKLGDSSTKKIQETLQKSPVDRQSHDVRDELSNSFTNGDSGLRLSLPTPPIRPPQITEKVSDADTTPDDVSISPPPQKPNITEGDHGEAELNTSHSTITDHKDKPIVTPIIIGDTPAHPFKIPEEVPRLSDATSTVDALRIVVMTRLVCDRQTREERVNPVLLTNMAIAPRPEKSDFSTSPQQVINEVQSGEHLAKRVDSFSKCKKSLIEHFERRQHIISEKVRKLKDEYIALHEKWLAHCSALNDQSKVVASEAEAVQPTGRTTRRSTAIGDMVRSDLEMEQIIASLGNDDATDPNHLSARNLATIPDMVSVSRGRVDILYDDTNHLVDNPSEYYAPQTGMHDWTDSEIEIFIDKFAAHPKQFGIIADYLPNKTVAQCVDYYYLHKKKHIDFRKVVTQYAPNKRKRRGTGKKRGNGLLADIAQHDAEVHRDSTSPALNGRNTRGRKTMPPPDPKRPTILRRPTNPTEGTPTSTPTPEPEGRTRRKRLVTMNPPSRTVSVSLDDTEEENKAQDSDHRPAKRAKRTRKVKPVSAAPEASRMHILQTRFVDQNDAASRKKVPTTSAHWSEDDKNLFLTLLAQHGDDFKRIAASMPNKTTIQVSNYYKGNLVELDLERVAASAPKRTPTPETNDTWKDLPFAGPVSVAPYNGILTNVGAPMASLHFEPRLPHTSILSSHSSHMPQSPRHVLNDPLQKSWQNTTQREWSLLSSSTLPKPDHLIARPISPTLIRHYPSPNYPPQNSQTTSGSFSLRSPSMSAAQRPYVYPHVSPEPHSQYPQFDPREYFDHPPDHRGMVSSISRGENPYPVVLSPKAPLPPPYYYS